MRNYDESSIINPPIAETPANALLPFLDFHRATQQAPS